jgi:hypothetical protein
MDINKVEVEKRRTFLDLNITYNGPKKDPRKVATRHALGGNSLDVEDLRVYPIQSELSNVIKLQVI